MLYKKILVPFDGSDPAKNALEVAKKLIGDDPEATLYIIAVIASGAIALELESPMHRKQKNPYLFPGADNYERIIQDTIGEAQKRLDAQTENLVDNVEYQVVREAFVAAKISDGIADFADRNGCEIIVMGRRGVGMLHGVVGSVSYGVLHKTDVPVLSVK